MAVSKRLRFEILRRDGYACRYCGGRAPDVALTVDHVIPVTLGGSNEPDNLVAACVDCNAGKSSSSADQQLVADVSADALRWAAAIKRASEIQAKQLLDEIAYLARFDEAWNEWAFGGQNPGETAFPGFRDDNWQQSVLGWRDAGLEIDALVALVHRVMEPNRVPAGRIWRYFCGAAWRTIRERQEIAQQLIAEEAT